MTSNKQDRCAQEEIGEERWQKPGGTATIESFEIDVTSCLLLAQKQARDQKTRQHEE
jgi:hypothetical protein